ERHQRRSESRTMKPRKLSFKVSLVLSLVSTALSVGVPALAQDEPPVGEAPTPEAPADEPPAPATDADADATEPLPDEPDSSHDAEEPPAEEPLEEPPAEEPLEEPPAEGPLEEPAAPLSEPQPEPVAPAPPPPEVTDEAPPVDPEAERDKAVSFVGIELLPFKSFFPEGYPVRGITNGSMWRNFQGLQIPYMPKIDNKPSLRIGVSGYIWNDLSTAHIDADERLAESNVNDQIRWTTQTRGLIRFTPTFNASNGWFAQGNAELVLSGDMTADPSTGVLATTDDLWVRA